MQSVSAKVSSAAPTLALDFLKVATALRLELSRAGYHSDSVTTYERESELRAAIQACEDLDTRMTEPRYSDFSSLTAMCQESPVVQERKRYDGFAFPFSKKFKRKNRARHLYEAQVASEMASLLLANQARALIVRAGLRGDKVSEPLMPTQQNCKNGDSEFSYPQSSIQSQLDSFVTVIGPEAMRDAAAVAEMSLEEANHIIQKNRQTLGRLCDAKILAGAVSEYVADPRSALLVFNSPAFPSGEEGLELKVSYCRYLDATEAADDVRKEANWIFDTISAIAATAGGPPGTGAASAANVGVYSYQLGVFQSRAKDAEEQYLAGTKGPDATAEAQNLATEFVMVATIVAAGEALTYALPVVGKGIANRLINGLRNGKLAKWVLEGTVKIGAKELSLFGHSVPLSALPKELVTKLRSVFGLVVRAGLAAKSKINLKALVDIEKRLRDNYGDTVAAQFLNRLKSGGRRSFDAIGCKGFLVIGTGALQVATH